MPSPLIIIAIISGIFALVVEIICSKQESKILWLGSVCMFFLMNTLYYTLFAPDPSKQSIGDRILIFVLVGMTTALISMAVASIILSFVPREKEEEEDKESVIKLGDDTEKEKDKEE